MNTEDQKRYENLKQLSTLLDSRFEGPLGFRFGLDGILGFIPFIGDFVTSGISFYIIFQAAFLGCAPSTLTRMALNVLFENLVDMIPFLGNIFDFFWKANNRNMALIDQHMINPHRVTIKSRLILSGLFLSLFGLIVLSAYLSWLAVMKILELISLATS
jgi:hypothetical protein